MKQRRNISLKDKKFVLKIGMLIFFMSLIFNCYRVVKNGEPMRNNKDAIFHGGVDGGHYFELIEFKNNVYRFKIFMDYNQKLFIDAYFQKIIDSCDISFDENNIHDFISNYDDNVIYLIDEKKGCELVLNELIYSW